MPSVASEEAVATFGTVLCAIFHGWHCPAEQVPGAQEWPQAPQLFASVWRSRQALPHWERPVLHDHPQVAAAPDPVQVAVAPEGAVHGVHDVPHVCGLVSSAQPAPHAWNPPLHDQAQAKVEPEGAHDAVALAGGVQGVQEEPQVATLVSSAQADPQAWKPELHAQPQDPEPEHVALALAGAVQGVQDEPQLCGLVSSAQVVEAPDPHRWCPASQATPQEPPLHAGLPCATVVVQVLPQPPQLSTSVAASTHALLQASRVDGHVNPHEYVPPEARHVAVAYWGVEQGEHEVPQLSGLELLAHVADEPLPQAW